MYTPQHPNLLPCGTLVFGNAPAEIRLKPALGALAEMERVSGLAIGELAKQGEGGKLSNAQIIAYLKILAIAPYSLPSAMDPFGQQALLAALKSALMQPLDLPLPSVLSSINFMGLMRTGLGVFRMREADFWAMTPASLAAACDGYAATQGIATAEIAPTPTRGELAEMMAAWPD